MCCAGEGKANLRSSRLFRQEALEKLSSPEQLDQLLKVTSPKGWLALLGLSGLIGAMIVWSIVGSIPSTIKGEGILIRGEAVQLIDTPQAGRVGKIAVKAGDNIQANQLIGTITTDTGDVEVRSPRAGRVLELRVSEGSFVPTGTVLVSFELAQEDLEAVLYLPAADGKKVHSGMDVQVSPSTVSQQEFGVLRGRVKSVSDYPATVQGMYRVLGSDELVRALSSEGAPIEVRVELFKADTPSGYQWSSQAGPPTPVQGGTFCAATIILGQRPPISMVLGS
jgi:HlyD family secretion protein